MNNLILLFEKNKKLYKNLTLVGIYIGAVLGIYLITNGVIN
jgi:hypothetical protein